jgi:hypothetical protein
MEAVTPYLDAGILTGLWPVLITAIEAGLVGGAVFALLFRVKKSHTGGSN